MVKIRDRVVRRFRRMIRLPSPSLEVLWFMEQDLRRLDLNRIQEDAAKVREVNDDDDEEAAGGGLPRAR